MKSKMQMFYRALSLLAFQTAFLVLVTRAADTVTYDACDAMQPGGAKCDCDDLSATPISYNCSHRNLTSVPQTYGNHTKSIFLNDNQISNIEPGVFDGLIQLEEIHLQLNRLQNITQGVFDYLPELEKVNLTYNQISYIEPGAFNGSSKINYIFLSDNKLESVTRGVFDHLNIFQINIDFNMISFIDPGAFKGMEWLHFLFLSYNFYINYIEPGTFSDLIRLRILGLNSNNIKHIEPGTFNKLKLLEAIRLNNNKLTNVTQGIFDQLPVLEYIHLHYNDISYIEPGAFKDLVQLKRIFLHFNSLKNVTKYVFNHLPVLEQIHLNNNEIGYMEPGAFDGLMRLEEIKLQFNRLERVITGVFDHLAALKNVDLRGNLIATLDRHSFFFTPSIEIIELDNNPLNCSCEEKLFRDFLDVRNNTVDLRDARCINLANVDLSLIDITQHPTFSCAGESLFVVNNNCYMCRDASDCYNSNYHNNILECSGIRDVCFSRIKYSNGHLDVTGGCSNYNTCLMDEAANKDSCLQGEITQCHYCSLGKLTNDIDVQNTVTSFEVGAEMILNSSLSPALLDRNSPTWERFKSDFVDQVNKLLYRQNGSYSVTVSDIRQPGVIVFTLLCHTIWYVPKTYVLRAINDSLLANEYDLNDMLVQPMRLTLILEEDEESICPSESVYTATFGLFNWPPTRAGNRSSIDCPNQKEEGEIIQATRACNHNFEALARWDAAMISQCLPSSRSSAELQRLANIQITDDNAIDVSANVSTLSENWSNYTEYELSWTVDIVEGILETDTVAESRDVIKNTLQTINDVLFIKSPPLEVGERNYDTSSRLVNSVDELFTKIDVTASNFSEVRDNIAGFVVKIEADTFTGISLSTDVRHGNRLTSGKIDVDLTGRAIRSDKSGIQIPSSAFSNLSPTARDKLSKGALNMYREPKIFDTITSIRQSNESALENNETVSRKINSLVIGASFPGVSLNQLPEPVKITFQHFEEAANPQCVYWKKINSTGGLWRDDGCQVNSTATDHTVCSCNHLTNFALLMDVYDSGGSLSEADTVALSFISYIGCGVSFIAMCLTIMTYIMFTKRRQKNPGKILINLCLAIGFADLVFVAGIQSYASNNATGCKIVAALLHFFLLAAMCWMVVEAFYMYLTIVKVFGSFIARFQLKSSLFGWGIPLVIVAVTLGINETDSYGLQPGEICWLARVPFYTAFLAPVAATMIINFIVFALVMRQIVERSSNKLTNTEKSKAALRVKGAVGVILLLGLTWVFAILAVGDFGLVFHYLFAILNSLQGLFIFCFYCVLKSDVRDLWKSKCTCFEKRSTTTATKFLEKGCGNDSDQTMKTNVSGSEGIDNSSGQ